MFILIVRKYCDPGLCSSQVGCNIYSKYLVKDKLTLDKLICEFKQLEKYAEHDYDTEWFKLEANSLKDKDYIALESSSINDDYDNFFKKECCNCGEISKLLFDCDECES